ncbi:MAG: hypothetical protein MK110_15525 [Fuerstiella sp.]|nr:hypothetical protein [Fuerstiella sp.]
MKKHGFKSWVFNRIEVQRRMTAAAPVGMAAVGLVLFLLEAGFLFLVFFSAYSATAGILVNLAVFGVMGLYTWNQARTDLCDRKHKAVCNNDKIVLNLVPATSSVWSWAFGSMDPDLSYGEKFIGIAMLVPRLFFGAWYTWHRLEDVKNIDSKTTLDVMKILFRSDQSVTVQAIADGIGDADLNKAIRDISLLDGVVFMTKEGVSVSIAPRLNEEFEAWRSIESTKDNGELVGR